MSRDALRVVFWLLPLAGVVAGSAREIIVWVFGRSFLPAAPLLAWLICGAVALMMNAVVVAILTAAGKPGWTLWLAGPLLPLALAGHLVLIPRWGATGAAVVTASIAGLGAAAGLLAVHRCCGVLPPAKTAGRSLVIAAGAATLSVLWPASGFWLPLKLTTLILTAGVSFWVLGEFDAAEIAGARTWFRESTARRAKVSAC